MHLKMIDPKVNINVTLEPLSIFMCLFIDTPSNGTDCSTITPEKCIRCCVRSSYFDPSETVNDIWGWGHITCLILWILSAVIGIFGTFGNLWIVAVVRRSAGRSLKGFNFLLMVLAHFDAIACLMVIIASTCHVIYFGNWSDRGKALMYSNYISWNILLLARSGSQCMTLLITIERWLVTSFPFRSDRWFTSIKTRVLTLAVILFVLMSTPRSVRQTVVYNTYHGRDPGGYDIPSMRDLEFYIQMNIKWDKPWYRYFLIVDFAVDYFVPLPLLLIFNFMSFWRVRKLVAKRKELNIQKMKEIQAVCMFLPVVAVLLCCSIVFLSMYVMAFALKFEYREFYMLSILSISVNSSVNVLIYYYRGSKFNEESKALLYEWFKIGERIERGGSSKRGTRSYEGGGPPKMLRGSESPPILGSSEL